MIELGVLADDLTGGMMVASLLERQGVSCPLVTSAAALASLPTGTEAVVVARKLRLIDARDAQTQAKLVAEALRAVGTRRIYYKFCATFDSTDEGNIGPVTEALMTATGAKQTIVCSAFPEYTVTVFQGRLFLGSILLGESFKQFDPVTPMTESNLVEILKPQTKKKVGLLSHDLLIRGSEAVRDALDRQEDTAMFVTDAVDDDDLRRIAEIVGHWPLTAGADGLPSFLAQVWRQGIETRQATPRTLLPAATGHEAIVAGSCAGATLRQLAHFEAHRPVYHIDLIKASQTSDPVSEVLAWAEQHLEEGPVAIATSADVESIDRVQAKLGRSGAAELADRLLGEIAVGLFDLGVRKFVVAGGETSGQVINALGITRVEVSAFDELGGGYCHQAKPTPISFVLKAGALGSPEFFFNALDRMRSAEVSDAEKGVGPGEHPTA
ncbi:MAG: 3-oxo-tetronate kinase [bacterium]